jgi:hypothetical protein
MNRDKAGIVVALISVLLCGLVAPQFVAAQSSVSQSYRMRLQTLIQVALSGRIYALGVLGLASSHGLNTGSAVSFLASGNTSLVAAQAGLNSGENLTTAIGVAQVAMRDFSNAASSASLALEEAGLTSSVEATAAEGALAVTNQTAVELASLVVRVCPNTSINSTYASQFQQSFATAGAEITNATSELKQAATIIVAVKAGQSGFSISVHASDCSGEGQHFNGGCPPCATIRVHILITSDGLREGSHYQRDSRCECYNR